MNITACIVAAIASACFLIEAVRGKSLVALGLAVFVAAFVLAFVVQGGPLWVIR